MNACIETTWKRSKQGYGIRSSGGRNLRAHRVAWEQANGPIPAGMHVCHHCDNPPCVRPSHIYPGTTQQNALDRVSRGRGKLPGVVKVLELGFCARGHELTPENTLQEKNGRRCRRCLRARRATYWAEVRK